MIEAAPAGLSRFSPPFTRRASCPITGQVHFCAYGGNTGADTGKRTGPSAIAIPCVGSICPRRAGAVMAPPGLMHRAAR